MRCDPLVFVLLWTNIPMINLFVQVENGKHSCHSVLYTVVVLPSIDKVPFVFKTVSCL